jgi:hypothetical protein
MGHKKVSSRRMATKASKSLRSNATSKGTKRLAGSVLSQSRGRHSKRK